MEKCVCRGKVVSIAFPASVCSTNLVPLSFCYRMACLPSSIDIGLRSLHSLAPANAASVLGRCVHASSDLRTAQALLDHGAAQAAVTAMRRSPESAPVQAGGAELLCVLACANGLHDVLESGAVGAALEAIHAQGRHRAVCLHALALLRRIAGDSYGRRILIGGGCGTVPILAALIDTSAVAGAVVVRRLADACWPRRE